MAFYMIFNTTFYTILFKKTKMLRGESKKAILLASNKNAFKIGETFSKQNFQNNIGKTLKNSKNTKDMQALVAQGLERLLGKV